MLVLPSRARSHRNPTAIHCGDGYVNRTRNPQPPAATLGLAVGPAAGRLTPLKTTTAAFSLPSSITPSLSPPALSPLLLPSCPLMALFLSPATAVGVAAAAAAAGAGMTVQLPK